MQFIPTIILSIIASTMINLPPYFLLHQQVQREELAYEVMKLKCEKLVDEEQEICEQRLQLKAISNLVRRGKLETRKKEMAMVFSLNAMSFFVVFAPLDKIAQTYN